MNHQSVELYITESWFNKTLNGQRHDPHVHPNSVVSGILYIDGENFHTTFEAPPACDFYFDSQPNMWNSNQCEFVFQKGDCVVFRSNIEHFVPPYMGDKPRITLSWNTFVKGNISSKPTTSLIL